MKPDSILYYPHIEFQNEAWVKSCLLLWNHVYRIVPEGYTPNDSDEIKALVDADLVRNIKLDDKDREVGCPVRCSEKQMLKSPIKLLI